MSEYDNFFTCGLDHVANQAVAAVLDVFGPNLSTACTPVPCLNNNRLTHPPRLTVKTGNDIAKLPALHSVSPIWVSSGTNASARQEKCVTTEKGFLISGTQSMM